MNSLVFILAERNIGWNLVRSMFATLDNVFFWLFNLVMQAVFDIANLELVESNAFADFQDRIYVILGIYMLFKVTISLLTYLVNPDMMLDKEKGLGKVVTRSVMSLCMLLMLPWVFNLLYRVQTPLLAALPRVILGTNTSITETQQQSSSIANQISVTLYSIVFERADGSTTAMGGEFNTVSDAIEHVNDPADGDNSVYKYKYTPLLGTVIAVVMAIILLGICIDVAIRAFKLVILRMIAPIPIISYMDPKSAKDGAFASWSKTLVSVWLELFLKVGVLFLVLALIDLIILQDNITWGTLENGPRKLMIQAIVIVGLLFFAKEAPEFVRKVLGIKGDKGSGGFLSGLGKIGAAAAIGAGTIGSAIASGRASWMSDEANGKKHNAGRFLKNMGAGILGAGTGLASGAGAALNAKDHARQKAIEAMNKRNANTLAMGAAGSTLSGRVVSGASRLFTGDSSASKGKRHISALDDFNKSLGVVKERAKSETVKQDWTVGELVKGDSSRTFNYKDFLAEMQAAEVRGASEFQVANKANNGKMETITMAEAKKNLAYLQSTNENDYIQRVTNTNDTAHNDAILMSAVADAEAKAIVVDGLDKDTYYPDGKFKISNRDSITKTQDAITIATTKEKRENAKKEVNDQFSNKK